MRLFSQPSQCIHSCRCDITLVQNSVNKFPWLSDFFSHPSLTRAYVLTKCMWWRMWWHTSVEALCFIFDKYCTMDSIWDLVDFCHTSNLVLGNRSPENEWRMPAMRRYSGNQRRCLLTWIYNCGHGRGSDGIVDVGISGLGRCLSSAGHQHARLRCHLLDTVNP